MPKSGGGGGGVGLRNPHKKGGKSAPKGRKGAKGGKKGGRGSQTKRGTR